jgi:ribonuclease HII
LKKLLPFFNEKLTEAGCDEAGRGCLAGPVVCASVILPKTFKNKWLNDSKQLTEKKRLELKSIIENEAISFHVTFIDEKTIDKINILNASILGMQEATLKLSKKPELLLVDGNRFHKFIIPHQCFVKGDCKFLSIAAASVLAKTYRDEYMLEIHKEFPQYNWIKNKGYPTLHHRNAVHEFGLTKYHRKTFQIKPNEQLKINYID